MRRGPTGSRSGSGRKEESEANQEGRAGEMPGPEFSDLANRIPEKFANLHPSSDRAEKPRVEVRRMRTAGIARQRGGFRSAARQPEPPRHAPARTAIHGPGDRIPTDTRTERTAQTTINHRYDGSTLPHRPASRRARGIVRDSDPGPHRSARKSRRRHSRPAP